MTFNSASQWLSDTQALGTALARTAKVERQTGTHLVTAAIDGLGRRTEYTYDTDGHVLTTTQLAGTGGAVTTTFTYEPQYGLLASITDPLAQVTTFGYDGQGRLTSVTDSLDQETTFTYDSAGQRLTATDALTQKTTFGYEVADLVAITDPLGRETTRFIDAAGRVLQVRDPLGRAIRYAYYALNRVTALTDPLAGQTAFTYDANGNPGSPAPPYEWTSTEL